jgi:hypothetical protein
MRVEHTLTVSGRCPVDGCPDEYECVVRTDRLLFVEVILAAVKAITLVPRTQEEVTRMLAEMLVCEVETVGVHSGVRSRVAAGPA